MINAKDMGWRSKWSSTIRPTTVPAIFERREGGHIIRTRMTDPATGRVVDVRKVLPDATLSQALAWLEDKRAAFKGASRAAASGVVTTPAPKPSIVRFADYAVDLRARKIASRVIVSPAGARKWKDHLEHLIGGTRDANERVLVRGFGEYFMRELRREHIVAWMLAVQSKLINVGLYAPTTANCWLATLRNISKHARFDLGLGASFDPCGGIEEFDTSEHETYTHESPNSLTLREVPIFLEALRRLRPAHYAMTVLGLATGLRPSSLRPLRRRGVRADIKWDEGVLLVRRSQTEGEVVETTKTRIKQRIQLPPSVLDVLRWHVETQLETPEQYESDLLFPSIVGGFRSPSVLNKPFVEVCQEIDLGKTFTQRGLRRTFQDLARAAGTPDLVTRSISGHATEQMQHHYSTVAGAEQSAAIARVVELAGVVLPATTQTTPTAAE